MHITAPNFLTVLTDTKRTKKFKFLSVTIASTFKQKFWQFGYIYENRSLIQLN